MTLEVGGLRTGDGPYTGPDSDRQLRALQPRERLPERQIYTGPDTRPDLITLRHLDRLADARAASLADADLDSPARHTPKFQPAASQRRRADGYRERAPEYRPAPQRRGERGYDERGYDERGYREPAPESRPAPQRRGERGYDERARGRRQARGMARLIAVLPAHNEEATIGDTVRSLARQSRPPDQVVVVCDNCTDDTAGVAASAGAKVFTTVGNTAKKAGALNQALGKLLPTFAGDDLVLVMDADSRLNKEWLEYARELLQDDPRIGAVCGIFLGEPGGGVIGQIQRNEYTRYARMVYRQRQTPVLSGTGSLFRIPALLRVARERGRTLPGKHGDFYNSSALTEDNEMTLAMKTLGYRTVAGEGCETTTEVMPDWHALFRQRLRWQKGALDDLRTYGLTRVTFSYWVKQIAIYGAFLLSIACWIIIGFALVHSPGFNLAWTAGILSINFGERLWTVRKVGWAGIVLSMLTLPEMGYDLFRLAVFFRAAADVVRGREVEWGHLNRSAQA
jgi:poly-beta-1,6-N-acetyl-D-glucosamine synthase